MRKWLTLAAVGSTLALSAIAAPSASAYTFCHGQFFISWNRYNTDVQQANFSLCIHSSGSGHELASLYSDPPHAGQLSGWHIAQLTDNNYEMAHSGWVANPWMPFHWYAGWVYHPYWGTYCARSIGKDQWGIFQDMPEVCFWTNGYQ